MNAEDSTNWINVAELLLKFGVAIATGAWSIALYRLLKRREHSLMDLRKKDIEIRDLGLRMKLAEAEIQKLELDMKRQAVVTVDIKPKIVRSVADSGYVILARVVLTNCGSRNTRIRWKDEAAAFYVRSVNFSTDNEPTYSNAIEQRVKLTRKPELESVSHVIRAGGTEAINFVAHVPQTGLYLLSFRGLVDEQEKAEAKKLGADLPVAWTANRYVLVNDTEE